uniref:Homeobox domain-containing protein n=1 Tax=Glossina brevipalpis TaxID=37001 RepID=A0A1A9WAJ1_9MUSC
MSDDHYITQRRLQLFVLRRTRTNDKYRVVYTDFQRLELEKEYCTSNYITIRRKTELAQTLSLSERQVKIWFQNRRAKARKQNKKSNDSLSVQAYSNFETKPKLEPGLQHLQHSFHSMSSIAAIGMPTMRLNTHLPGHHHPLTVSAAAAHQLHLHQGSPHTHQMTAAAAAVASVGSLTM